MGMTGPGSRPFRPANGEALAAMPFDALTEGHAGIGRFTAPRRDRRQGWNLFRGDIPLPAAVLRADRLEANDAWMAGSSRRTACSSHPTARRRWRPSFTPCSARAAPGRSRSRRRSNWPSRSTSGFRASSWRTSRRARESIDACFAAMSDEAFELHVLADSLEGVTALGAEGAGRRSGRNVRLGVLVEMGVPGGRTGTRTREQALAVARAVVRGAGLDLTGIECFEGILPDMPARSTRCSTTCCGRVGGRRRGSVPARPAGHPQRRRQRVLRSCRRALRGRDFPRPNGSQDHPQRLLPDARRYRLCQGARAHPGGDAPAPPAGPPRGLRWRSGPTSSRGPSRRRRS